MIISEFTIAVGGTISTSLNSSGQYISRIETPASIVSTTLSFQVSMDGTTFKPARTNTGAAYTITVAANLSIPIPPEITAGGLACRIVAGSTETSGLVIKTTIERI